MYENELNLLKEDVQKVMDTLEEKRTDGATPQFGIMSDEEKSFIYETLEKIQKEVIAPLNPEAVNAFDENDEKWNINIINESLEKGLAWFDDIYWDFACTVDEYNNNLENTYINVVNICAVLDAEVSISQALQLLEEAYEKTNNENYNVFTMHGENKHISENFSYADIFVLYEMASKQKERGWNKYMRNFLPSEQEEEYQPKERSFSKSFENAQKASGVVGAKILIDTKEWYIMVKFDGKPDEERKNYVKVDNGFIWNGKYSCWRAKFSVEVVEKLSSIMQRLGISEKDAIVDIATGKSLSKDWKKELMDFAKMPYPQRMEHSAKLPATPFEGFLKELEGQKSDYKNHSSSAPAMDSAPSNLTTEKVVVEKIVEVEKEDDRLLSNFLGYYYNKDETTGQGCGIYRHVLNGDEYEDQYLTDECLGESICNILSWDDYFKEHFTQVKLDTPFQMEKMFFLQMITDKFLSDTCNEGKNIYSSKDNSLLFDMVNACFDAGMKNDLQMFSLACTYILYVQSKMYDVGLLVNKQSDFEVKVITDVCEDFVAKMELYKQQLPIYEFIESHSNYDSLEKSILEDIATHIDDTQMENFKFHVSEMNEYISDRRNFYRKVICDLCLKDYKDVVSEQTIQVAKVLSLLVGEVEVSKAKETFDKMAFGYYLKDASTLTKENASTVVSDNKLISLQTYEKETPIEENYSPYQPQQTCVGYAEFSYPLRKKEVDGLSLVPTRASQILSKKVYQNTKNYIDNQYKKVEQQLKQKEKTDTGDR